MKTLVLDFETTNKYYGDAVYEDNSIVHTCYLYDGILYSNFNSIYKQEHLVNLLKGDVILVAQNAKFELKWLQNAGMDVTSLRVFDTMIAEYVLNGNRSGMLNLDFLASKYLGSGKDKFIDCSMKAGICPSELPQSLIAERCKKDVIQTFGVYKRQRKLLHDKGLVKVAATRFSLTPILADIEHNGMFLDSKRVEEETKKAEDALLNSTRALNQMTGGINPKSSKQVCEFVYDVLKFKPLKEMGEDVRSANAAVLERLTPTNNKQRKFLELKKEQSKYAAQLDKSLKHFLLCCNNKDVLYANFNQCVTRTHRLSSSGSKYGVQFQNLPREFKKLFTVRNEGWHIVEVDGAQLEFRVAAFLGQDKQAYDDIVNGVDVHSYTASTITAAGQPTTRQEAKAHTFKPLFSGTSGTEAEKAYYTAFKKKYSGVAKTQEGWVNEVLLSKQLRIASGLICYWPNCKRTKSGYIEESSKIYNLPVQSLATAEIIPVALMSLSKRMKEANMQSFIVNTVHDSVIAEVAPDEIVQYVDLAVECFTESVYNYLKEEYNIQFNVPLGVGIKIGAHWGEADAETTNYVNSNSKYSYCVVVDKNELKYTPNCKFEWKE